MKERCRHERHSWLISGGLVEWCYVCGAFRSLKLVTLPNVYAADSKWYRPSGDKDKNPWKQNFNRR